VTITRRADYDKSVSLDVLLQHLGSVYGNPLPPGVTIDAGKSKTLIGTGNSGHIVLKAAANAAPIEKVPVSGLAHVSINFVVKIRYWGPGVPAECEKVAARGAARRGIGTPVWRGGLPTNGFNSSFDKPTGAPKSGAGGIARPHPRRTHFFERRMSHPSEELL